MYAIETNPFSDLAVPVELQASLDRHLLQVSALVGHLRSAGLSETQIEHSVSTIVESYRNELLRAIKALAR